MSRNRLAVWMAGILAGVSMLGGFGCNRPDPAASAMSATHQQQVDTLRSQISALQEELRNRPTTIAAPTSAATGPTHADLTALERKLARLEALQISAEEFQKLKLATESGAKENGRLLAELAALRAKYETLLGECAQREMRIQTLVTGRDEILAQIDAQQTQMAALRTQIESRWAELFDKLSRQTGPAGSNPALDAELQRLRQELAASTDEVGRLTTQLAESDDELKKLRKKVSDQALQIKQLQDANEQLNGTAGTQPTPGATNVPAPVTSGALMGELLQIQAGSSLITGIVKFPPNTEFRNGARYNIFNARGEKVADFQVTSNNTPEQLASQELWFGGIVTPLKPEVLPAARDRVTNLTSLPPSR